MFCLKVKHDTISLVWRELNMINYLYTYTNIRRVDYVSMCMLMNSDRLDDR